MHLVQFHKFLKLLNWKWLCVEKTLRFFAFFSFEERCLLGSFNSLGDNLETKIVGHDNKRTNDGGVL